MRPRLGSSRLTGALASTAASPGNGKPPIFPSPRPGSTTQALAGRQYALSMVTLPNPLVVLWRWRYELILGIGLPVALAVFVGIPVMLGTLAALAVISGAALYLAPARRHLLARAWCLITPHRVRVGCAQAWIHSRRGKIPIVLLTTRQPFGERVHLWCRAGTGAVDFTSARPLLTAACWARDIRVSGGERHAQLITLDVIRHLPSGQPGNSRPGQPDDREQTSAQRASSVRPHPGDRGDDRDLHVGLPGHQAGGPPGRLPG